MSARRTHLAVLLWRIALWNADWIGRAIRWFFVEARSVTMLALLIPALLLWNGDHHDAATVIALVWILTLLSLAAWQARNRFVVGEFTQTGASGEKEKAPAVDLADLLQVELSRLGDLFRVVGDRRAVESGLGRQAALDATLTVDDLVKSLQGTITAESKASVGPLSIPLAPLVAIFGRLLQAPRLSGSLHRDGERAILTAQTSRRPGLSWRVPPDNETGTQAGEECELSAMVEEMALRVYTDLALGRAVRWEASALFVDGLRRFRSCLRTPKDRKVNLKLTEDRFLKALAEDEDFPLVYYNLGVVYTELHGLAVAAGRDQEARMHLSAAESSFGRAIEKDPSRWEGYFAFAQTQFHHQRWDSVAELCAHILKLKPNRSAKAKTRELWARALVARDREDEFPEAVRLARSAARAALVSLLLARLWRQPSARAEDDPESRCAALAAGCMLTLTDIFSRQMQDAGALSDGRVRSWHQDRIRRRVQSLTKLAPLPHGKAQLHYDVGMRALDRGKLELAVDQLGIAARSDPTRTTYSAGLALARARLARRGGRTMTKEERDEVVGLCRRALQGLAGAFSPARDAGACETVADAYDTMGDKAHGDDRTARELRRVAEGVRTRLADPAGGGSVSSLFLKEIQSSRLQEKVGAYGQAAQKAQLSLARGREFASRGRRAGALASFRGALGAAERATSLNPLSTLAWETLGDVHRELSDFQNARTAWEQALATDPDNATLYDKIGSSYWHIASEGRSRVSDDDLRQARQYFEGALLLYGSGSYNEQLLTHERLGKLNAALLNFHEARRHLEIVEAMGHLQPLVGWQQLGFGYLRVRNFAECEYYFGRVVREADEMTRRFGPDHVVGDRLDEQRWPLGLVRAWGHLGLAISAAERDGDLGRAEGHLATAEQAIAELALDPQDPSSDLRFPTRAPATVIECRGFIHLRRLELQDAIAALERAIGMYPHSRAYLELALALEQRAAADLERRDEDIARARRLLEHGVSVGPTELPSGEFERALQRLSSPNGASA